MNQEQDFPQQPKQPAQQLQQQPLRIARSRYKSFWKVLLIIVVISLSSFYFGYTIIYLSVIDFYTVIDIFSIDMERKNAEGLLTFCVPLGGLIGAWASSYFINNISRRKSIICINYVAFAAGFFIFLVDFKLYMLVRAIQGFCAGSFSALVPLIIKETAPFELSGLFGVFHQLFITIGIFTCCILTYILSLVHKDDTGKTFWHLIFGFPLIIITLQTICLNTLFRYETPKYLIDHNQEDEARQIIERIYFPQFVDEVVKELNADRKDSTGQQQNEVQSSQNIKKQLTITKKVALHLALLQQFVGISAVATYARAIAEGSLSNFKPILPSILNFQQVASAVLSSFLLTKYGRKTILQAGTMGAACANLVIAIGFYVQKSHPTLSVALVLTALFYYMANFGLSLGPIVWMYIPEIVRPQFLPYSTMVNWGGSALSILLFPIIKARLPDENPAPMFLFFTVWSFVSYWVNKKFVIETRNKTGTQIEEEYRVLQGAEK